MVIFLFSFALSFIVSISAADCLERLVSKVTYYLSSSTQSAKLYIHSLKNIAEIYWNILRIEYSGILGLFLCFML